LATFLLNLNNLKGSNGFTIPGLAEDDNLGTTVDLTGDLNGDGIEDLVISSSNAGKANTAPYDFYNSDRRGETYVIFGKKSKFGSKFNLNSLSGNNGFTVTGGNKDDRLGSAVTTGDINGDGIDDLIVSAPNGGSRISNGSYNYSASQGRIYIIFGKKNNSAKIDVNSLNGSNGFTLGGINQEDYLGTAVASGDLNGDGIDDLAVSAAGAGKTITNEDNFKYSDRRGETYVIFGKKGKFSSQPNLAKLNGSNGFKIQGENAYDRLGYTLSNAGDINGDGIDDLVLGTPAGGKVSNSPYSANNQSDRRGKAYIIFGSRNGFPSNFNLAKLNGTKGFEIAGINEEDNLGSAVNNAGDINGDGIDDLILGASQASHDGKYTYQGGVYVVFGQKNSFPTHFDLQDLNGKNGFSIPGLNRDDALGHGVSTGDINGDGIDDLLMTANTAGKTIKKFGYSYSDLRGETYILYGTKNGFAAEIDLDNLTTNKGGKIEGNEPNGIFGSAISSNGDINGDNIDDFVVSAPNVDISGKYTAEGSAYLVFGSTPKKNNSFNSNNSNNSLAGTNNNDNLNGTSKNDNISGLAGNDTIWGNQGNDTLRGNDNNDLVAGRSGADLIYGGNGNDTLWGNENNDTIYGGNGNDTLNGGSNKDSLIGGGGGDRLNGESGNDTLSGNDGNDSLWGGTGNDSLDSGTGNDILNGQIGNDTLNGNGGNDTLNGNRGNNTLNGNKGNDRLSGGTGNDILSGGSGNDNVFGGTGNDILGGGSGRDTLKGNAKADRLEGHDGNDTLSGGSGNDTLYGGLGNDLIYSNEDSDILYGVGANNSDLGVNQLDTLVGGADRDIFMLGDFGEVYYDDGNLNTKGTSDFALIRNFNQSQDRIKLMGNEYEYRLNLYRNSTGDINAQILYNPGNYSRGEMIALIEDVRSDFIINDSIFNFI